MASKSFPARTTILASDALSHEFVPITPWIPAILVARVQIARKVRDVDGSPYTRCAYQVAETDPDSPGGWTVFGNNEQGADEYLAQTDSLSTDSAYFVRFGVGIASSTFGVYEQAEITTRVAVDSY